MKITSFWYVTPYSLVEVHRLFGGKYSLHVQGRRVIYENNKKEAGSEVSQVTPCNSVNFLSNELPPS